MRRLKKTLSKAVNAVSTMAKKVQDEQNTIKKMAHTMRKVGVKEMKEGLDDLKALPKDLKKSIKKNRNEVFFESNTEDGMTTNHIYYEIDGKGYG